MGNSIRCFHLFESCVVLQECEKSLRVCDFSARSAGRTEVQGHRGKSWAARLKRQHMRRKMHLNESVFKVITESHSKVITWPPLSCEWNTKCSIWFPFAVVFQKTYYCIAYTHCFGVGCYTVGCIRQFLSRMEKIKLQSLFWLLMWICRL